MRRVITNRWWALTAALLLGCASVLLLPARSRASSIVVADPGGGVGTDPGQSGSGDPDSPSNNRKGKPTVVGRGYASGVQAETGAMTTAGSNALVLRIQVALQVFRVYWLRF